MNEEVFMATKERQLSLRKYYVKALKKAYIALTYIKTIKINLQIATV